MIVITYIHQSPKYFNIWLNHMSLDNRRLHAERSMYHWYLLQLFLRWDHFVLKEKILFNTVDLSQRCIFFLIWEIVTVNSHGLLQLLTRCSNLLCSMIRSYFINHTASQLTGGPTASYCTKCWPVRWVPYNDDGLGSVAILYTRTMRCTRVTENRKADHNRKMWRWMSLTAVSKCYGSLSCKYSAYDTKQRIANLARFYIIDYSNWLVFV